MARKKRAWNFCKFQALGFKKQVISKPQKGAGDFIKLILFKNYHSRLLYVLSF